MRLSLPATLSLIASSLSGSGQDRLALKNGDLFVGELVAFQDGFIQLQSPHGVEPLKIPDESLAELKFGGLSGTALNDLALPKNSQEVILKNGDRFPGEILALDDSGITFKTWFTGDLKIRREEIESLYFGVTPQETVYRGPSDLQEWDLDNSRSWRLENNVLIASQKSAIGKDLNLPRNFIFRASISWQSTPSSRVYLCAPKSSLDLNDPGDCYRVELNPSYIEVSRAIAKEDGKTAFQELLKPVFNLSDRNSKKVELELRIDRESHQIDLYVDDVKVSQGLDPNTPPEGSCLVLESTNHASGDMMVDDVTVSKWDTTTQRLRVEPRASNDTDTLSISDGDRFSGEIVAYDPAEREGTFSIKTALRPEPLLVPLQRCAVLYFAEGTEIPSGQGDYQIKMETGGTLTLSDIELTPENLTATHPWLGKLKIDRRVMKSITKSE